MILLALVVYPLLLRWSTSLSLFWAGWAPSQNPIDQPALITYGDATGIGLRLLLLVMSVKTLVTPTARCSQPNSSAQATPIAELRPTGQLAVTGTRLC